MVITLVITGYILSNIIIHVFDNNMQDFRASCLVELNIARFCMWKHQWNHT